MIFGGPPAFLAALGGEDLCALVAPTPRGLPLPERGGGGTADVLCEDGDDAAGGADERTSPKDGLSWGAGDGAMAMAALMIGDVARGKLRCASASKCVGGRQA